MTRRWWGRRATCAVLIGGLVAGCAAEGDPEESGRSRLGPGAASLYVRPDSFDFSGNPDLLARIRATPHGYFRFINIPFSRLLCERYGHLIDRGPLGPDRFPFNLHGDAHVEQYAVTDLGRGLTDFDDSSEGPPWIDGLRFSVSLRLAARQNGWEDRADEVVAAFNRGYRDVIADSSMEAPVPAVARRIRAGFERDGDSYLAWVDSIMAPLPPDRERALRAAMAPYAELMFSQEPELPDRYFEPVQAGALQLGVGSALEPKYLVRLRGPTDDPLDDVVLELKRVRSLSGIPCIQADDDDPFRVLVSGARIAYRPFRFLGFVELEGDVFWTHAWVANYRELQVSESFRSADELAEVAYDVGVQLGIGHLRDVGGPFQRMVRARVSEGVQEVARELYDGSRVLADEVEEAWRLFVARSEAGAP